MNYTKWLSKNCPSVKGKRVVITGATGGLGSEICHYFAKLEANLTIACRNQKLANELISKLKLVQPNTNVDFVKLDLEDIDSVKSCLTFLKKYNGIDIFVNNAGVYNIPLKTLQNGYNNIFTINFVNTYYLTKQLLPELEKKPNSLCITLGSIAHNYSKIDLNDIDFSHRKKPSKIYGNSKRFLMFSFFELFKNSSVKLAIVHPGITLTKMTSHYPKAINWLIKPAVGLLFPNKKKAALCVLYALSHTPAHHEWIGPRLFNVWGKPKITKLKTCKPDEADNITTLAEKIYNDIQK